MYVYTNIIHNRSIFPLSFIYTVCTILSISIDCINLEEADPRSAVCTNRTCPRTPLTPIEKADSHWRFVSKLVDCLIVLTMYCNGYLAYNCLFLNYILYSSYFFPFILLAFLFSFRLETQVAYFLRQRFLLWYNKLCLPVIEYYLIYAQHNHERNKSHTEMLACISTTHSYSPPPL